MLRILLRQVLFDLLRSDLEFKQFFLGHSLTLIGLTRMSYKLPGLLVLQ